MQLYYLMFYRIQSLAELDGSAGQICPAGRQLIITAVLGNASY